MGFAEQWLQEGQHGHEAFSNAIASVRLFDESAPRAGGSGGLSADMRLSEFVAVYYKPVHLLTHDARPRTFDEVDQSVKLWSRIYRRPAAGGNLRLAQSRFRRAAQRADRALRENTLCQHGPQALRRDPDDSRPVRAAVAGQSRRAGAALRRPRHPASACRGHDAHRGPLHGARDHRAGRQRRRGRAAQGTCPARRANTFGGSTDWITTRGCGSAA